MKLELNFREQEAVSNSADSFSACVIPTFPTLFLRAAELLLPDVTHICLEPQYALHHHHHQNPITTSTGFSQAQENSRYISEQRRTENTGDKYDLNQKVHSPTHFTTPLKKKLKSTCILNSANNVHPLLLMKADSSWGKACGGTTPNTSC